MNIGEKIAMKFFEKGGVHFRSEKFHCKFSAGATGLRRNRNEIFRKRGGEGGSKAVRKFSGNSSVLGETGFPYPLHTKNPITWNLTLCGFHTHLKVHRGWVTLAISNLTRRRKAEATQEGAIRPPT